MRISSAAFGTASLLFCSLAFSQAGGHGGHVPAQQASKPAPTLPQKPVVRGAPVDLKQPPASPAFHGYLPYKTDEPLVGWKEANDLVLEIGGHVGIMKGAAGKDETPGAHAGHSKSKSSGASKK